MIQAQCIGKVIFAIRALGGFCAVLTLNFWSAGVSAEVIRLQVAPKALAQLGPEGRVVLITGLAGPPNIRVRDPSIIDVTPPEMNGVAAAFEVRRVAAGSTQIQVSDSSGRSITIPVADVPNCLPPPGHFRFVRRELGRASLPHEPSHPTKLYFKTDQQLDVSESAFAVRLVDGDGLVQKASPLTPISNSPALHDGATSNQASTGVYVSYAEALAVNNAYHIWLVRSACEPPYDLGSFST